MKCENLKYDTLNWNLPACVRLDSGAGGQKIMLIGEENQKSNYEEPMCETLDEHEATYVHLNSDAPNFDNVNYAEFG